MKIAGAFASTGSRVILSGKVDRLEFSSTRAVTGGSWTIDGAGMGLELLEVGGWIGPFIACIGVAVALFLAWDVPRVAATRKFHGHTPIQPLTNRDDSGWLSTLPGW